MPEDKDKQVTIDTEDIPEEAIKELSNNEGGGVGVE